MNSIILLTAIRVLRPLLLVSSIFVLLRGHNDPGGGFVGGLLAASAFSLVAIGSSVKQARRDLRVDPHVLMGVGLLVAAASGLPALAQDQPLFTAKWWTLPLLPGVGLDVSTVLLFDIGVYMVVAGTVLLAVFTLAEELK